MAMELDGVVAVFVLADQFAAPLISPSLSALGILVVALL